MFKEANEPFLTHRVEKSLDVGVDNPPHLRAANPCHQRVQRIMLAASWPEAVREPEEIFLVYLVQHGGGRSLDDLVLERRHGERTLLAIGFRYVAPTRRLRPIRSPVDFLMQIRELLLQIAFVVLPRHPIHSGRGVSLEGEKRQSKQISRDVVKERGEPFLLSLSRDVPYALQRS